MSDVKIVLELPEELVEGARAKGLTLNSHRVAAMIEVELERMDAANYLWRAAQDLQGTLSPEEVEAKLAAAKAERIAQL